MAVRNSIASVVEVRKSYMMGAVLVEALRGLSVEFLEGDYCTIMGPSGCGKSTLLNVLGCLDRPTSGQYLLGGDDVSKLDDDTLSSIRGERIGFVFQSYNLIQQLTVLENIEVPLFYQGRPEAECRAISTQLATRVGLAQRMDHKPYELSGGQQQRVAVARALVNDPLIILADEPTGNLDSTSGSDILNLFDELRDQGKTIIMVTHSDEVSARADRVIRLRDGVVERDERHN
ncbi:MAG: macrolide ABC transporter ATP-binding protein [Candidatus Hydrogenedentota bacterium]